MSGGDHGRMARVRLIEELEDSGLDTTIHRNVLSWCYLWVVDDDGPTPEQFKELKALSSSSNLLHNVAKKVTQFDAMKSYRRTYLQHREQWTPDEHGVPTPTTSQLSAMKRDCDNFQGITIESAGHIKPWCYHSNDEVYKAVEHMFHPYSDEEMKAYKGKKKPHPETAISFLIKARSKFVIKEFNGAKEMVKKHFIVISDSQIIAGLKDYRLGVIPNSNQFGEHCKKELNKSACVWVANEIVRMRRNDDSPFPTWESLVAYFQSCDEGIDALESQLSEFLLENISGKAAADYDLVMKNRVIQSFRRALDIQPEHISPTTSNANSVVYHSFRGLKHNAVFVNKDVFQLNEMDEQCKDDQLVSFGIVCADVVFVDPPYGFDLADWDTEAESQVWQSNSNIAHLWKNLQDLSFVDGNTVVILFTPHVRGENPLYQVCSFSSQFFFFLLFFQTFFHMYPDREIKNLKFNVFCSKKKKP